MKRREAPPMNRREFLAVTGAVGAASLAGCSGMLQNRSPYAPPVVEDRPDAVYIPSHVEGMAMIGMQKAGPYGCALAYTYPHRFWLTTGTRTKRVSIQPDDSIHLMAMVWDRETNQVLPDASPSVDVTAAGESITSLNPWSMLSQPMGYHFGDNVQLPTQGSYTVDVGIAAPSFARYGMPEGPDGQTSCSFDFEYSRADRDDLSLKKFPEKKGSKGAVPVMSMKMAPTSQVPEADALPVMSMKMAPTSQVPEADALPGRRIGTARSGDADFVVTVLDDASPFGGSADQSSLAVSPRTPYNRHMLPLMALSATVERGGTTVFDGPLQSAIEPSLSVHYGAVLDDVQSGDAITISVDTPPQLARHEGYETAFLDMPAMSLTV